MTIPFSNNRKRWMRDPAFREAYERVGPDMDLAFTIAEARIRAGLSQKQLAERVGTTQSVISRWESGRVAPSTRSMKRIAGATKSRLLVRLTPL